MLNREEERSDDEREADFDRYDKHNDSNPKARLFLLPLSRRSHNRWLTQVYPIRARVKSTRFYLSSMDPDIGEFRHHNSCDVHRTLDANP